MFSLKNSVVFNRKCSFSVFFVFCAFLIIITQFPESKPYFYVENELKITTIDPKDNTQMRKNGEIISVTDRLLPKTQTKKFRIDTKGCKIPDWPIFDEETIPLYRNLSKMRIRCGLRKPLIKITRVNSTWIQLDWTKLSFKPLCYISQMSRGANNDEVIYGKMSGPINSIINLPNYELVKVFCYENPNKYYNKKFQRLGIASNLNLIYEEIIPLIPQHRSMIRPNIISNKIPNILLISINSISYLNFKRHFLLTEQFLKRNKFFELKGYNKVGVNTWQNMIPLLAGLSADEFDIKFQKSKTNSDKLDIIWEKFAYKGFHTLLFEDLMENRMFSKEKMNLNYGPNDYFLIPYSLSIKKNKYYSYCYNGKLETEHYFDYVYDFAKAMKNRDKKYFAFISLSEVSHDSLNKGAFMDRPTHKFLSNLFTFNLTDDTVVLFFSDHGMRFGPIRRTHSGEIESRLPFMFIHIPTSIKTDLKKYLLLNQDRLSTPFDIHATLMHILNGIHSLVKQNIPIYSKFEMNYHLIYEGKANHSLPHGLSLFEEFSGNRDCNKASIPEHYCSCSDDIRVQISEETNSMALKIIDQINTMTEDFRPKCHKFELHSIHAIYERIITNSEDKNFGNSNIKTYLIQVFARPGNALFESTVKSFDNKSYVIIGEISRINRHKNPLHCIHNSYVEKYCFCKN